MTEVEMVGWHHQFNEHPFKQILGEREVQGVLSCYSPCNRKRVGHKCVTEQQQHSKSQELFFKITLKFI